LAFGIGPLFACVGSLLQDALLNGEMLGGRTFGLEFPQNYLAMFAGAAPLLLFAGLAISVFVVPESAESNSSRESTLAEIRAGLRQFIRTRFVLFAVIIYVIVYSGGNAIFSNVSLHAKDVLPNQGDTVGLQNFLRFGCKAVAGALLGLLLAKANPRATLVATTSILLVGMGWALTSSGWWFMATFGILGAGELFGAHFPNYVTSASSKAFVRINIAYLSVLSTMVGFSSLAFGLISDNFGRIASFYAAAVLLGLALVLIYVLLPANPKPRETGQDFTSTG
jgi:predicted MFS family arabinose efflux permease